MCTVIIVMHVNAYCYAVLLEDTHNMTHVQSCCSVMLCLKCVSTNSHMVPRRLSRSGKDLRHWSSAHLSVPFKSLRRPPSMSNGSCWNIEWGNVHTTHCIHHSMYLSSWDHLFSYPYRQCFPQRQNMLQSAMLLGLLGRTLEFFTYSTYQSKRFKSGL